MAPGRGAFRHFTRFLTEDWLAVVVGLALVALVLVGLLKRVP
jgi:hypothetical protein